VTIGTNTVLHGKAITITASATAETKFDEKHPSDKELSRDDLSSDEKDFLDSLETNSLLYLAEMVDDNTFDILPALAEFTKATATIDVLSGAQIIGSGDVSLDATATGKLTIDTVNTVVSILYANLKTDAAIRVVDGTITGSTVSLKTLSDGDLKLASSNEGKDDKKIAADFGVSLGVSDYSSLISVDADSVLSSTGTRADHSSIELISELKRASDISAVAGGPSADNYVGAALAISYQQGDSAISVAGTLSGNSIKVDASTDVTSNEISASSDMGGKAEDWNADTEAYGSTIINKIKDFTGALSSKTGSSEGSAEGSDKPSTSFNLAAAVTYSQNQNTTGVAISGDLTTTVGDLEIGALTTDRYKNSAEANVASDTSSESTATDIAVSAGLIVTNLYNDTDVLIGATADLAAAGKMVLSSKTDLPYQVGLDPFASNFGIGSFSDLINVGSTIFKGDVYSTHAAANSEAETLGAAGAINLLFIDNATATIVKNGATLNDGLVAPADAQDVSITAETITRTVNATGGLKELIKLEDSGAKTGVGGSYTGLFFGNTTLAVVEGGATINASDLTVEAETLAIDVAMAASGGKAGSFAINGSATSARYRNHTLAKIDDGSIIDAGGKVLVSANDQLYNVTVTGGVSKGSNVGVGISVSVSDVDREVLAIVGNTRVDRNDDGVLELVDFDGSGSRLGTDAIAGTAGSLAADKGLEIAATTTGFNGAYSLAAAITSKSKDTKESTGVKQADGGSSEGQGDKGNYGISVSGDVSVNLVGGSVLALITDKINVAVGDDATPATPDLNVHASNDTNLQAIAGSVAISTTDGTSVGIAGAYSHNMVSGDVLAGIMASREVTVHDTILVNASQDGDILSITAGGAGAKSDSGVGIAGSASYNSISGDTQAFLNDTSVGTYAGHAVAPSLGIEATNDSMIIAVAGAVGYGGKAGIGASLAIANIDNNTRAYAEDSDITADDLSILASNNSFILSVSAAGGISKDALGVGGAFSVNLIDDDTEAGLYRVGAADAPLISLAGSFSLQALDGTAAVQPYDVSDEIPSLPSQLVDGSGDIEVNVLRDDLGKGDQGTYDSSGDPLNGRTRQETLAGVDGTVNMKIVALNISVAASDQVALGANAAYNQVTNKARAVLDGVEVTVGNGASADLSATSSGTILAIGIGGSGSSSGALSATVGVNRIGNDTSVNLLNGASLTATGASVPALTAADQSMIISIAGGGAGSGDIAGSAAVAFNQIANDTLVYVSGSTISAVSNVLMTANDETSIYSITVAGSGSGSAALSGAVSINTIGSLFPASASASTESGLRTLVDATTSGTDFDHHWTGISLLSATVKSGGILDMQAENDATILSIGLGGAGAGDFAGGLSGTYNNLGGKAFVEATNSTLEGVTGNTMNSLLADAQANGLVVSVGIGAAGAGSVAIGGSMVVNNVGSGTDVVFTGSAVLVNGDISLSSSTNTDIISVVGAGAGSGTVAAGAAGAVNLLSGSTLTSISGGTTESLTDSISLTADQTGWAISVAAAGSGAGAVNFSGSVGVNLVSYTTIAEITNSANVDADDNVLVDAASEANIISVSGGGGGSGTVSLGGSIAVNDVTSQTRARILNSAVDARANGGTLTVTDLDAAGNTRALRGIAVVADADDYVESIVLNGSGSGGVNFNGSGSVNLLNGTTESLASSANLNLQDVS
jgi:hypothetical protein